MLFYLNIYLYVLICEYVCVCVWVCVQACKYPWRTEGGISSSGAVVSGSHKLPNMGTGNPTQVRIAHILLLTTESAF